MAKLYHQLYEYILCKFIKVEDDCVISFPFIE